MGQALLAAESSSVPQEVSMSQPRNCVISGGFGFRILAWGNQLACFRPVIRTPLKLNTVVTRAVIGPPGRAKVFYWLTLQY